MKFPKKLQNLLENEIDPAFAKRAEFIFNIIANYKPTKILDVGCGRGFYIHGCSFFNDIKEICGIDTNKNYLDTARNNSSNNKIKLRQASIYSIPYSNNYFDLIICSEVLEHLKDDSKGLRELYRVLKPKGLLVITVPNANFPFFWDPVNWLLMKMFGTHINKNIWWLAGIWADHERLYNQKEIESKVIKNHFKIMSVKKVVNTCWPFSHFLFYGIGKNLVEKLKLKKFNRFEYKNKRGFASILFNRFISLPSNLFQNDIDPSANICLTAKKQ